MRPEIPMVDRCKFVMGCAPAALATTAGDGDYVSMKNFSHLTIVISVLNGAIITAGDVTLLQATKVDGTGAKALAFTKMWANTDCAAADTLTETAVTSNTFATDTTNSKQLMYVIEVPATSLDINNNFDCVRIDVANSANSVGSVLYILHGARYQSPLAISAITD